MDSDLPQPSAGSPWGILSKDVTCCKSSSRNINLTVAKSMTRTKSDRLGGLF